MSEEFVESLRKFAVDARFVRLVETYRFGFEVAGVAMGYSTKSDLERAQPPERDAGHVFGPPALRYAGWPVYVDAEIPRGKVEFLSEAEIEKRGYREESR